MTPDAVPYGRKTQKPSPVSDVHILWITAGLGCDGDSVSITAATQPSIEDVFLGAIPGLPKVHLHNPVLAYENGDEFMKYLYQAEQGNSIRSCWSSKARFPTKRLRRKATGRRWEQIRIPGSRSRPGMDRSPRAQGAGSGGERNVRHVRRNSRDGGQSHRLHGLGGLSRLGLEIQGWTANRECARMPRAA